MSTSAVNQAAENSGVSAYSETKRKNQVNGKTIGKPELSEKAQKYYEKLKKKFEAERKAWADEKVVLLHRAEQAEATLAETTTELSGLKRHVSQMVSAIFGKLLCKC